MTIALALPLRHWPGASLPVLLAVLALALAAARGVQAEWVVADLSTYEPELEAFDLVAVSYLQLSAPQRAVAMRVAARAVAPGGVLLVLAHDSANLDGGYGEPPNPAVLYTAQDVAADIAGSGLVVDALLRARRAPLCQMITSPG